MLLDMQLVVRRILRDQGFAADLPAFHLPEAIAESARDLRDLPWSSIDNADSKDLDQIEVAEQVEDDAIRVRVGIADVDAFVPKGSPVDHYAAQNTTSLYTGVHTFPMLPEELSNDRTSLLGHVERFAVVTDMIVHADGSVEDGATQIYVARVVNHARLVYEDGGAWLESPRAGTFDAVIAAQLQLQDLAARRLSALRHERGALDLETIEARPVASGGRIVDLEVVHKNRARSLVEDLMIAANGATARYLEMRGFSSIRRVVRAPKRWDRIVDLAASFGATLPDAPSAGALARFMAARKQAAPDLFGELSLSIVKMMGAGEYVLQRATDPDIGHFGLAVDDYTHSTAPNRRYPDLVTQRLLKACAASRPSPYRDDELVAIAARCTERQNAARKVERTMRKVAAAAMLSERIGEEFDAIVTGAADKGTFVRLVRPPAEGRVVRGEHGLDVGDRVRVRLLATDASRGFVDFAAIRV